MALSILVSPIHSHYMFSLLIFQSFKDAEDPEPKTTYEVAFLASDSWKKVGLYFFFFPISLAQLFLNINRIMGDVQTGRSSDAVKERDVSKSGVMTATTNHDQNIEVFHICM